MRSIVFVASLICCLVLPDMVSAMTVAPGATVAITQVDGLRSERSGIIGKRARLPLPLPEASKAGSGFAPSWKIDRVP
jgi:hypothetical protein